MYGLYVFDKVVSIYLNQMGHQDSGIIYQLLLNYLA